MPKETFFKLKDEKKQRIFCAAVKEFSMHSYSESSLNQIVKAANIPWGSFYQYFDDKEDVFSYVLETILKEIEVMEKQTLPAYEECDALSQFANRLSATIELNNSNPEYVRIAIVNANETAPIVKRYFQLSEEHKQTVISIFERDKRHGLVREDVDVSAVIDMVYILSKELYFELGLDSGAYLRKMDTFLQIIRSGIKTGGLV